MEGYVQIWNVKEKEKEWSEEGERYERVGKGEVLGEQRKEKEGKIMDWESRGRVH